MGLFQKIYRVPSKLFTRSLAYLEHFLFSKKTAATKKNTLVILRLDSIGDYVLFRNFIEAIKKSSRFQNYEITLCGNSWWKELSENLDANYITSFIWIDYQKMADPLYRFKTLKKIHSKGFEALIHPTYSRDALSDLIVSYSGAELKIGSSGDLINLTEFEKEKNDKFYSELLPSPKSCMFEFYRNKLFFEELLLGKFNLSRPTISIQNNIEKKIILCPGAKDAFRRWNPLNFVALTKLLQRDFPNHEFLICGSSQDAVFAAEMIKNFPNTFKDHTGKLSLNELMNFFSKAELIVTNDSGPFHIAVALNRKSICISNGNNYGRFTPYPIEMQTLSAVVYPKELLNINSEKERLDKYCKHGSTLNINSISAEDVYEVIKKIGQAID